MKYPLGQKLYFSISEVAEITDLQPYILRTWEKEFACLRPRRLRGKNRAYRQRDINLILLIKRLLYEERFTIQGVRQKLKHNTDLIREAIGQEEPDTTKDDGEPGTDATEQNTPSSESAGSPPVAPPVVAEKNEAPSEQIPVQKQQVIDEVKAELREILRLLV